MIPSTFPVRMTLAGLTGALLVLCGIPATTARADVASCSGSGMMFSGGAGTTASPYQVTNQTQLAGITGDYLACAFRQTADISLSGPWAPIGAIVGSEEPYYVTNAPFTGSYDGNSKTISGLSIIAAGAANNADGIGLFASMNGATVRNLVISNAAVDSIYRENVGILVGVAVQSAIEAVRTSGTVRGLQMVGGIAGKLSEGSTITRSSSSAAVTTYFGGGGGLVGNASKDQGESNVRVVSSNASGTVTGTNDDNGKGAGGLVGTSYGGLSIEDSWATGNVSMLGGAITGGLIGLMYGADVSVTRSFATGSVTVVGTGPAGGLIGGMYNGATIANSFSTGSVTGQVKVGGLVGFIGGASAGTITNSYSLSPVTTSPIDGTGGGILGAGDDTLNSVSSGITAAFWNITSAGASATNSYGTAKTLDSMKLTSTYSEGGWDISEARAGSSVWLINPASGCLPYLRGMPSSRVGSPDLSGAITCVPRLTVKVAVGTKVPGARFRVSATGIQPGCPVKIWVKGSAEVTDANSTGFAAVTLIAPKIKGVWGVTATVSGDGCVRAFGKASVTVRK